MIGFESVSNIPRLAVAYADAISSQLEIAIWEIERGCLSPIRKHTIRRNRRWLNELATEAQLRVTRG